MTLTGERFVRDEAFDLAAYWQQHIEQARNHMHLYSFMLRIPEAKAEFLRFHIPGNSTITELVDEPGWFKAQVQVPSVDYAKMLVLGPRRRRWSRRSYG